MSASVRGWCMLVLLLGTAGNCPAEDKPLSRVEIGKIGKAATALVEVKARRSSGSAFCIHPSGLFLTNEHVVQGGDVTLVLGPGLKNEKVFQARVVRADKDLDLALLSAEGARDLPALSLGSDEDLAELAEVVAFGFPFGTALATDGKERPTVSVNAGSVTALRRKGGKLHRIQLDAVLNPGNSGGPVLDKSGKVIGVVVAGVRGSGVNFAIPISQAASFVSRPVIRFEPPSLSADNMHEPTPFEAEVVPVLPAAGPLSVELSLKAGKGRQRTHKMEEGKGRYRATIVPLPPPSGPLPLRLAARFDNGSLNVVVADRTFKVGEREMKLSAVRRAQFKPQPRLVLHDGKAVEGAVSGLEAVPVKLGGQALTVDLAKATELRLTPEAETDQVWCMLVVRQGEKEIYRHSESLLIQGLLPSPSQEAGPSGIKPPILEGDKVERKLPSAVADVVVGGGGRYLLLHLPKARKLAVFDVNAAEIVARIPLAEDGAKFAAGLEHVVVLLPGAAAIERWSLKTFQRDSATPLPIKGLIKAVAMGSASKGPLLIHWAVGGEQLSRAAFTLLDVETMKVIEREIKVYPALGSTFRDLVHLRASANGKLFGLWCTSHTPSGMGTIVLSDTDIQSHYAHSSVGHVLPSPDGKTVFTMSGKQRRRVTLTDRLATGNPTVPACHGDYYLSLPGLKQRGFPTVLSPTSARPIATLTNLDLAAPDEKFIKDDFTFDKRVHLIPEARLIVVIPVTNDRLVLHRLGSESAGVGQPVRTGALRSFLGHTRAVTSVAMFGEGRRALSGGFDQTLRLWDLESGKELRRFLGHGNVIWCVAVSPDGKHALSGSQDKTVRLWEVATGKELCLLKGHQGIVSSIAFFPDGRRALSASWDKTVRLWDTVAETESKRFDLDAPITALAISGDGKRVLFGSNDAVLRLWDVQTGKEVRRLACPGDIVEGVAFSLDGRQAAAAHADKTVRLYDLESGKEVRRFAGHTDKVDSVAFSPDGRRLLSCGVDRTVRVWDAASGRELFCFEEHQDKVRGAVFSPDGRRVLSGSYDSSLKLWDLLP